MKNFRYFLPIFMGLFCWSEVTLAQLSRDALNRQYQGIKGFSAHAIQSRTSPYLLKALQSEVDVSYKKDVLSWKVQGQEKLEIRFEKNKAPELSGDGTLTNNMPAAAKARLLDTLKAFRSLMLLEPQLEEDFQLTIKGNELIISPRPHKVDVFFQEIVLLFDKELQLQSMLFKTKDEETLLKFSELKWVK